MRNTVILPDGMDPRKDKLAEADLVEKRRSAHRWMEDNPWARYMNVKVRRHFKQSARIQRLHYPE